MIYYINLFKDYLTHYHSNITFNNEAINGLTSKQLLNNIKNNINLQNKIKCRYNCYEYWWYVI